MVWSIIQGQAKHKLDADIRRSMKEADGNPQQQTRIHLNVLHKGLDQIVIDIQNILYAIERKKNLV